MKLIHSLFFNFIKSILILKRLSNVAKIFISFIFLFLLFIQYNYLYSQDNNTVDSLQTLIKKENNDSIKAELLVELGDAYEYSNPDSAIYYYLKAVKFVDNCKSESKGLSWVKAKALRYAGYISWNQGDYDFALNNYLNALKICEKNEDNKGIYNCFNNIGIINHKQLQYKNALTYYNKALKIASSIDDIKGQSQVYINLGNLYFDQGDSTKDKLKQRTFYETAITFYKKSLELKRELEDIKGISLCLNNLGNITKKQGNDADVKSEKLNYFKTSLQYYHQTIQLSEQIGDKAGLSMVYANISNLHIFISEVDESLHANKKNQTDSAIFYGEKAFEIANKIQSIFLMNEVSVLLKNMYAKMGMNDEALRYAEIFIKTREELYNEDKAEALSEMMTRYESEKKDDDIRLLEQEKEINQLQISQTKKQLIYVISFAILLLILLFFLIVQIKQKRKINSVLSEKNKELDLLNSTKNKYFSILSHDLKTPISAFFNISSSLAENFTKINPMDAEKIIVKMRDSADKTQQLLANILLWASSQEKRINFNPQSVSLNEWVNSNIELVKHFANERNVLLSKNEFEELKIMADKNMIDTILRNLLTNAVKFTPSEGRVWVECNKVLKNNNSFIQVSVNDTGCGISDEDITKLFRIDVSVSDIGDSDAKGSGLGLIICKEFIQFHGGEIFVKSELGKGSSFNILLPL